jgi:SAM-dependent methyltransferase
VIYNNKHFYEEAIKKHGVSAQGVHWKNQQTQYKRFEAITSFLKKDLSSLSIVDAGCGFGEYYNYLLKNGMALKEYIGLDCEKQMIKKAKQRFPKINFYQKDILFDPLPKADVYLSSGALNILEIDEVEQFIQRIYEHSYKALIFNSLKGFTFNGVKKTDIIQIVQRLNANCTIKEDYLENDFTIYIKK